MPITEFKQGSVIHLEGEPVDNIYLITEGSADATFGGHRFKLEKADVIGLFDLAKGKHSCTYKATSDVNVYPYPYDGFGALETLLKDNADISYLIVNSMCRQITECLHYKTRLKKEAEDAYTLSQELYAEYVRLCRTYATTPKKLPGLAEVQAFSGEDPVEDWMQEYYTEIRDMDTNAHRRFFYSKQGITSGFLRKCADDIALAVQASRVYQEYTSGISGLFVDKGGFDLFSLISDLHIGSMNVKGADETVAALMTQFSGVASGMTGIDQGYYRDRLNAYRDELASKRSVKEESSDALSSTSMSQELLDSLETIVKYSGCPDEVCMKFTRLIHEYTEHPDRGGHDESASNLRRAITPVFYEIYKGAFLNNLRFPSTSTVIKMFLKFGYVDPTLAGFHNADFLYSIADTYKGDPERSIYTVSEWLEAIYRGKVDPSLSEFDMDFPAYVRDMKNNRQIDAKEEARLLADQDAKLRYEMENAFPVVNRVTFGNPSRFCPVFAEHNLTRNIEDMLLTPERVTKIIDEIREIDYTAFYRETSFQDIKLGIQSESINVEILPNIVLMPMVGTRGSMWQEIEGRLRTTPSRMFLPTFSDTDFKTLLLRLTAEFRWEMCKRVQGARWNDMSDPSLTSYFCDYLQFYTNNREISMQTMTAIRNELSGARNNFKTVFVQNYVTWMVNESAGAARLNNIAIEVLMQFCPFSAPVRERLATNMRYNKALTKYKIKQQKRTQKLNATFKMLNSTGKQAPQELLDELEFTKR